jgi:hypothetical protein
MLYLHFKWGPRPPWLKVLNDRSLLLLPSCLLALPALKQTPGEVDEDLEEEVRWLLRVDSSTWRVFSLYRCCA